MYRATLIPGDGIGPEVTNAAVRVIEAAGVDIQWETKYIGQIALEKYGNPLPEDTIRSIEDNKGRRRSSNGTWTTTCCS